MDEVRKMTGRERGEKTTNWGGDDRRARCEKLKLWLWGLFFTCQLERSPRCYGHRGPESPSPVAVETGINSDGEPRFDKTSSDSTLHRHNWGVCSRSCWHTPRQSSHLKMGTWAIVNTRGHTWQETCLLCYTQIHTLDLLLCPLASSPQWVERTSRVFLFSVCRTPITSSW